MKYVPATEAKARFSSLLSDVERGETVCITRHGKVVARLAPGINTDERRNQARRAVDRLKAWRRTLPQTEMTVDDILEARDEGRK